MASSKPQSRNPAPKGNGHRPVFAEPFRCPHRNRHKASYRSKARAEKAIRMTHREPGARQYAYFHAECGFWHIASVRL